MTDMAVGEQPIFLSRLVAGRGERRLAFAVVAASTVAFLVLAAFAKAPLAPVPAFIPIYQSALVITDMVTVVFLLGQRQFAGSNALALLAGGYAFTATMSILHALTFPGLFAERGLLHAGSQTTAWLYMFWHSGFPLFVIAYVSLDALDRRQQAARPAAASIVPVPVLVLALVLTLAGACALAATLGSHLLPVLLTPAGYTPAMMAVVWSVWLVNLCALVAIAHRKPYSVLDLWLMVTMCAWLFDIALSAGLNSGRYDLGFYAGRIYGLCAASFILIVLLTRNAGLYAALIRLRESDRAKTEELQRLTGIDALTGIANRRAFEIALEQEWRRTMRHGTALSLLMVDVDYFKRFNDTYGHVAGDRCLRDVAQEIGRRSRRAGELAARYGGEEFAILLPHTDIAAARRLGELLCQTIRERAIPHAGSDVSIVTLSVGAACISRLPNAAGLLARDSASSELSPGATVLVEAADRALYDAKLAGRNRVIAACPDTPAAVAMPVASRG